MFVKFANYYYLYVFSQLPGITDHPGPATCPRIENEVDSSVILISSGKVQAISVKPVNIKVIYLFIVIIINVFLTLHRSSFKG